MILSPKTPNLRHLTSVEIRVLIPSLGEAAPSRPVRMNRTSWGIHKSLTTPSLICQKLTLYSHGMSADKLVCTILISKLSNWPFEAKIH